MHYLIGDLQGCCDALARLLEKIDFSPSRDRLYLLGDLVNRGPDSLTTLRRLQSLGDAAQCLLGNHDLHLLATAAGVRAPHKGDTLDAILQAPDREALLEWMRRQRLAMRAQGWLMVHAGVVPQWDADETLALAEEVHALLRGPELAEFLPQMYGNEPDRWKDELTGVPRLRVSINVLTRIRFCNAKGPTLSPIYRTAPQAALADPALHRLLALLDALRTGRARERSMASKLMEIELTQAFAGKVAAHAPR